MKVTVILSYATADACTNSDTWPDASFYIDGGALVITKRVDGTSTAVAVYSPSGYVFAEQEG